MGRRKTRATYIKQKAEPVAIDTTINESKPSNSRFEMFWNSISTFWKVIGVLFIIGGGILSFVQLYDIFFPPKEKPIIEKTARQKFDENYIDSTLRPTSLPATTSEKHYSVLESTPILTTPVRVDYPIIKGLKLSNDSTFPVVSFFLGHTLVLVLRQDLKKGIKLSLNMKRDCPSSYISFVEKDNRVYVSTEFKALMNEETIGVIDYNHWRLCKKELFDYRNTDDKLEVIDRQNQIAFSIKFEIGIVGTNVIEVSGYFINPTAITILSFHGDRSPNGSIALKGGIDTCLDKSINKWKEKSQILISDIKTIFPVY